MYSAPFLTVIGLLSPSFGRSEEYKKQLQISQISQPHHFDLTTHLDLPHFIDISGS